MGWRALSSAPRRSVCGPPQVSNLGKSALRSIFERVIHLAQLRRELFALAFLSNRSSSRVVPFVGEPCIRVLISVICERQPLFRQIVKCTPKLKVANMLCALDTFSGLGSKFFR